MDDNTNTTALTIHTIQEFRAPSWAGDWCAKCEWGRHLHRLPRRLDRLTGPPDRPTGAS